MRLLEENNLPKNTYKAIVKNAIAQYKKAAKNSKTNKTTTTTTTTTSTTDPDKNSNGIGKISADGKTLTDTNGVKYLVSAKVTNSQLKKNAKIADKKSGGKYRITKVTKNKETGKVTGGTVEYVAPYNKKCKTISATGKVKLGGVTFKVTSLAPNCAKGCKNLTKVVIAGSVTKIGKNAFNGCKKLKTIQIKTTKLTKKTVGANAFKGINSKAAITVPKNKLSAYKKLLKARGITASTQTIK
jgi:hypothetical protein